VWRALDLALILLAVVAFAAWATTHALLCYYEAHRSLVRAGFMLICFPLVLVWGRPYRKLLVTWIALLVGYTSCLSAAWLRAFG
jgi:hypothetical protein